MRFRVDICCDNVAFGDLQAEVARILVRITDRMPTPGGDTLILRDSNGNPCGEAWFEEEG